MGADIFDGIESRVKGRLGWRRGYPTLEACIPSLDTFGRLFGLIEQRFIVGGDVVLPALGAYKSTTRRASCGVMFLKM